MPTMQDGHLTARARSIRSPTAKRKMPTMYALWATRYNASRRNFGPAGTQLGYPQGLITCGQHAQAVLKLSTI
jgi:hypothetical protein